MKRSILWSLALVLCLAGCASGKSPEETVTPAPEEPSVTQTQPTQTQPTQPETQPTQPQTQPPDPTEPTESLAQPEPMDEDFVKVGDYLPNMVIELRYATENNFTGQQIYDFSEAWLRYGTVKKLIPVQRKLESMGLSLKLWDGFRPRSAQFKLWYVCPDPNYVSDPRNGLNNHSRGNTVDVTLVDSSGMELVMPSGFDEFSSLGDRDYSDCTEEAATNAILLEQLMHEHGFNLYAGEWWHFTDSQTYPIAEEFEPKTATLCFADCREYISLRPQPSVTAEAITHISVGEQFLVIANYGDFVLVEYKGLLGYVLGDYARPIE